jgi:hypothetical protein
MIAPEAADRGITASRLADAVRYFAVGSQDARRASKLTLPVAG